MRNDNTPHDIVRLLYLLITASVLPLSVLYLKLYYPEGFDGLKSVSTVITVAGGLFWSIFFIIFEQRYFPSGIRGALVSLGALVANGFSGMNLGSFSPLYGAYSILVGSLISLTAYMAVMTALFLNRNTRGKYFYYTERGYITLLLAAAGSLSLLLFIFFHPLIDEFTSEPSVVWRGVYLCSLLFYIAEEFMVYYRHNMFNYDIDGLRVERDKVLQRWGVPVSVSVIASTMSALFIAALM